MYYPSASGGNQSPIDIVTEDAIVELDYSPGANPLQISYSPSATNAAGGLAVSGGGTATASETMLLVNTGNMARVNVVDSKSCESVADSGNWCPIPQEGGRSRIFFRGEGRGFFGNATRSEGVCAYSIIFCICE